MEGATPLQEIMLEFRAGKMFLEGTRVLPDTRKGLVRIGRGEEGLVHLQWLDRNSNVVEDDQIVFPDEACFEKVTQTSERVYILKFNADNRKFFFWMQEPRAEGDSQICELVNNFLNRPIDAMVEDDAEDEEALNPLQVTEFSEDTGEDDLSSRAGDLVQQSSATQSTGEVMSAAPVRLEDLQRILSSIQPADPDAGLGLGDILKPELIAPLVETLPVEKELASYLPEGSSTTSDIIEVLQSPPFRQQLDSFTHVLRTGQIDLTQFGINPTRYNFTVISFLEALEDSVASKSGETQERDHSKPPSCAGADSMDES